MSRILSKPVVKTYDLGDGDTVTFAQLTEGDYNVIGDREGGQERRYNPDGTFRGVYEVVNLRRSYVTGIYRTMVSCTLHWPEEEEPIFQSKEVDGQQRVRFAMNELAFNQQWDMLPVDLCDDLIEKFLEHNPTLLGGSKATSKK